VAEILNPAFNASSGAFERFLPFKKSSIPVDICSIYVKLKEFQYQEFNVKVKDINP